MLNRLGIGAGNIRIIKLLFNSQCMHELVFLLLYMESRHDSFCVIGCASGLALSNERFSLVFA